MAYGQHKIHIQDLSPNTAIGIKLPFNAPAVFFSTYFTKDAIRTNLINYFLTNKTEIYLNPNFGGNIRAFIFEQIVQGNLDSLKQDIQSKLAIFFPTITVNSLNIDSQPDLNTITVTLNYSIINSNLTDQLVLILAQ